MVKRKATNKQPPGFHSVRNIQFFIPGFFRKILSYKPFDKKRSCYVKLMVTIFIQFFIKNFYMLLLFAFKKISS